MVAPEKYGPNSTHAVGDEAANGGIAEGGVALIVFDQQGDGIGGAVGKGDAAGVVDLFNGQLHALLGLLAASGLRTGHRSGKTEDDLTRSAFGKGAGAREQHHRNEDRQ